MIGQLQFLGSNLIIPGPLFQIPFPSMLLKFWFLIIIASHNKILQSKWTIRSATLSLCLLTNKVWLPDTFHDHIYIYIYMVEFSSNHNEMTIHFFFSNSFFFYSFSVSFSLSTFPKFSDLYSLNSMEINIYNSNLYRYTLNQSRLEGEQAAGRLR